MDPGHLRCENRYIDPVTATQQEFPTSGTVTMNGSYVELDVATSGPVQVTITPTP